MRGSRLCSLQLVGLLLMVVLVLPGCDKPKPKPDPSATNSGSAQDASPGSQAPSQDNKPETAPTGQVGRQDIKPDAAGTSQAGNQDTNLASQDAEDLPDKAAPRIEEEKPALPAIFASSAEKMHPAAQVFQPGDHGKALALDREEAHVQFTAALDGVYELQLTSTGATPLDYRITTESDDLIESGAIHPQLAFSDGVELVCRQGARYMVTIKAAASPAEGERVRIQVNGPDELIAAQIADMDPNQPPEQGTFRDEAFLLEQLATDPSEKNFAALAELRYGKAIDLAHIAESELDDAAMELAIRYGQSAVRLAPENVDYKLLLGALFLKTSNQPEFAVRAELTLEEILAQQSGQTDALLMLTQLCFQQQNFADCIDHAEKLLSAAHGEGKDLDPALISMLTSSYILDGQMPRGVELLGKMAQERFQDVLVLGYAVLLQQTGETTKAKDQLLRVQQSEASSDHSRDYAKLLLSAWQEEVQG